MRFLDAIFLVMAVSGAPLIPGQTNPPPNQVQGVPKPDRAEKVQMDIANGFFSKEFYELALSEYQKYIEWFPTGYALEETTYRIGECHRLMGHPKEARAQYESVLKKYPRSDFAGRSHFRIGEMEWADKKYDLAVEHFGKAAELADGAQTRLTARFYQARAYIDNQERKKAIPVLRELVQDPEIHPYRGFGYMELGRLLEEEKSDEAYILYSKVLDTDASELLKGEAALRAGNLALSMKNWKRSEELFRFALKSDLPEAWREIAVYQLLQSLYQLNRYQDVLDLANNPPYPFPKDKSSDIVLLKAHAQRMLKHFAEAATLYHQFLDINPDYPDASNIKYEEIICLYAATDDRWDAMAADFLEKYPDSAHAPWLIYLRADHAGRENHHKEAAGLYQKLALNDIPAQYHADIRYGMAESLLLSGALAEADKAFVDFVNAFPEDPRVIKAWLQLGYLREKAEQKQEALKAYDVLIHIKKKPDEHREALFRAALLHGELKEYHQMRTCFESFVKENPKDPRVADATYWIGWSHFEAKEYEKALPYLLKAREGKIRDFTDSATSRIILCHYFLKHLEPLMKELHHLPGDYPQIEPEILYWVATQCFQQKRYAVALPYYRQLIANPKATPWIKSCRWDLADCYAQNKQWKEAVEEWIAYSKDYTEPEDVIAVQLKLAQGYLQLQQWEESRAAAEQVLKLQPEGRNNAEARMLLGDLNTVEKHPQEAGKYYLSVAILYEDSHLTPLALSKAIQSFEQIGETNQVQKLRLDLQKRYPDFKPVP